MDDTIRWIACRTVDEVIRGGNLNAVWDIFSEDFVDHSPSPGQGPGREGLRMVLAEYLTAFPDLTIEIQDIIAEGTKVATREVWHGTHIGEFRGILPTGRSISRTVIHIFRVVEGKIAEEWSEGTDLVHQITT